MARAKTDLLVVSPYFVPGGHDETVCRQSGLPQVSMPLGQRLGAPLGLSLLGPAGSDASLVRLAQRIANTR